MISILKKKINMWVILPIIHKHLYLTLSDLAVSYSACLLSAQEHYVNFFSYFF